jgi:putative Holliday junction resolvase
VAVDDELGLLAHPRGVLDGRRRSVLLASLRSLADEEDIGRFVVGLPLDMTGGSGDAARNATEVAQQIAEFTGRPVDVWDERLSTVQAARSLAASQVRGAKARGHIDEASACVILQSWLDARRFRRKG